MRRSVSNKERARLFALHAGECHICGVKISSGEAWELEHVIPLAYSGDDSDANRKPAHIKCHARKTKDDRKDIAKVDRMKMKFEGSWRSRFPMRKRLPTPPSPHKGG
jgi:5-methylcytosine-specific restriction protein A